MCCRTEGKGWHIIERAAEHYGVPVAKLLIGPKATPTLPWNTTTDGRSQRAGGPPEANPDFDTAHRTLLTNRTAMRYLRERGIPRPIVTKYRFGYAQPNPKRPPGIIIPVALHFGMSFRVRYWPDKWVNPVGEEIKEANPRGHAQALWYAPPTATDPPDRVLCEGPLDAAVLRARGFAAWGAPGAGVPDDLLCQMAFNARTVSVILDVGAEESADRAVEHIRAFGAFAFRVDLPDGWPRGSDVTDFFIKHGRTSHDFRHLIDAAGAARRK